MGRLKWQLPVAIAGMFLGLLVVMLFNTQKREGFPFLYEAGSSGLSRHLTVLEQERQALEKDLAGAREKLRDYENAAGKESGLFEAMKSQLDELRMQAGLVPMQGPGVLVALDDSLRKPGPNDDVWFYIVHDVDLQTLVNELRAAGAEAIAVNDQRLVAGSAIRCVGPTVLVNTVRLSPPYIVKAIGPGGDLYRALKMNGGFFDSMRPSMSNGVRVTISQQKRVVIPPFSGGIDFRYGKPLEPSPSPTRSGPP